MRVPFGAPRRVGLKACFQPARAAKAADRAQGARGGVERGHVRVVARRVVDGVAALGHRARAGVVPHLIHLHRVRVG